MTALGASPLLLTALQRTIYCLFTVHGSLCMTSSRAGPHTATAPPLSLLPMLPEHIADIQKISAKNNGRSTSDPKKQASMGWSQAHGRVVGTVGALPPFRACSPGTRTLPQETRPFSWKDAERSGLAPGRFGSGRASLSLPLAARQLSQATENWDNIREEVSLCSIYTQPGSNTEREPLFFPLYMSEPSSMTVPLSYKDSCGHMN